MLMWSSKYDRQDKADTFGRRELYIKGLGISDGTMVLFTKVKIKICAFLTLGSINLACCS